ncbi:MAG TPA: ribosomal-processing cysteine protease Prp [Candidatus Binatia bacterium]|nr:ribosomal-processing cysteine protease Prp [Candidatus Binatia bacterium]
MLEVTFYRDGEDRLSGLFARGHADFGDHGEDIVCAAVSAILQAADLGLKEHARAALESRKSPGELELRWGAGERDREGVQAIAATAELAVEQIARRYPEHVRIKRVREAADRRRADDV